MGLHDTMYIGLKASVSFREYQVDSTVPKWNSKIQHIWNWRFL